MLKTSVQMRRSLFLVMGVFTTSALFAAGFEKNVLWSGKYQGFGGAATSSVDDSEAMFFNPAGLGFVEGKGDVRLNFSPTFSKFEGPVSSLSTQNSKESEDGFSPVGGLTSAYRLNDKFVLGAGAFVSGGTNVYYTGVGNLNGASQSKLAIVDFTAGGAVKLSDEFSVGAAWRATYAKAALASVASNNNTHLKLNNLKAWDFGSFRVGAQFEKETYGVGLNIRTPVKLNLEGDAEVYNGGPFSGKFADSVTVASSLPFQIALGTHYEITSRLTLLGDVSWTNYAANQKLDISTSSTTNAVLIGSSTNDILLKWHDQWVGRLGAQYELTEMWTLRGGYVLTSKVTSDEYARATFTPPGLGHTLTAGVGADFGNLEADLAVDYSYVSGSGRNAVDNYTGDFKTTAYAAHLGVAYNY